MKISENKGNGAKAVSSAKSTVVRGQEPVGSTAPTGSVGDAGSPVEISGMGRLVGEASRALSALPDVRVEKVERIQSALESGSYEISGEAVAEKMVADAVGELRHRSG